MIENKLSLLFLSIIIDQYYNYSIVVYHWLEEDWVKLISKYVRRVSKGGGHLGHVPPPPWA